MEVKAKKWTRNRALTKHRLLQALATVLAEEGFDGLGINRIAEQAGVSKVLIYRYFGSLTGLFEESIRSGYTFPLPTGEPTDSSRFAGLYQQMTTLFRQARTSQAAYEVLQMVVDPEEAAAAPVAEAFHQVMTPLTKEVRLAGRSDNAAVMALLVGGMAHLTLQAHNRRPVLGIQLDEESGWQRIEAALGDVLSALSQDAEPLTSLQALPTDEKMASQT